MKKIILLTTVAFALWGCSQEQDDLGTDPVTYDPTQVITVVTDLPETRGTPITSSANLMDFGLYCAYTGTSNWTSAASLAKMNNTKLLRTAAGGAWQYDGAPVYWDAATASDKYTFFAYAPYATASNGITINAAATGTPTLTYNVPTTTANQPDLMVAVPQKNVVAGSTVTLEMKHALACIGFQIAGNGEKVTAISISGVIMSGTLDMDPTSGSSYTVNWSNPGTAQTTDLSPIINSTPHTTTPTMTTNLLAGNGYLMMIPQTLTAGAKLKVTYQDASYVEFDLSGEVWKAGDKRTYNITTEVTVSPSVIAFPSTGSAGTANAISVTCSKQTINWNLQIAPAASWLTIGENPLGTGAGTSVSGTGNKTIYAFAGANSTGTNLTATITINGTTTVVVTVTQMKAPVVEDIIDDTTAGHYVGAFWRAEQKGERIINVPSNTTPWIATVEWMDANWAANDIMLSTDPSADAGVDFSDENAIPGNAESYPVTGSMKSVYGSGAILFRIGLKTAWNATPTVPARYAVIVLSYGTDYGTSRRLFLRQGHEADYVMRYGDPLTKAPSTGWDGNRTSIVKFSPYNLTAPMYKTDNPLFDGSDVANHATIPPRTSIPAANVSDYFTDFPTQAGAFFQWAGGSAAVERRAYHPTNPVGAITTGWITTNVTGFWNTLSTVHETCPPGWRRANDGTTTSIISSGNVTGSETRQSLFLNPQNGITGNGDNFVWGYYADGYFDRRAIVASVTNEPARAVAAESSIPSYIGYLCYNPTTKASLFLPAAGYRNGSSANSGTILYAGREGYSYTSTTMNTNTLGAFLDFHSTTGYLFYATKRDARNIRCVAESVTPPSFTVDPFNPDTNPTELKD